LPLLLKLPNLATYRTISRNAFCIFYTAFLFNMIILRMAFPQFRLITFLFIIGYFVLVGREFIKNKKDWSWLRKSVYLLPYILVLIFYGVPILLGEYYPLLLKEFLKGVLFLFIILGMYQFINGKTGFGLFKRYFFRQLAVISSLIVIFSILTYFFSSEIAFFSSFDVDHYNSLAISLASDYNFYSLYIILGFVSILIVSVEYSQKRNIASFLLALLLLLYTFTLIMSFSRRAFVVFVLILISLVVYMVYKNYGKRVYSVLFSQLLKNYLIVFSAGIIFILFTFYYVPDNLKKQIAQNIKPSFSKEVTNLVNRYRSVFTPNEELETTYNLIWDQDSVITKNSIRSNLRNKLSQWFYEPKKNKKDKEGKIADNVNSADTNALIADEIENGGDQAKNPGNIFHSFNSMYKDYFINTESNSVDGQGSLKYGRTERWIYAVKMFNNYSLSHKLFGNGFSYLNDYKQKFARKGAAYDYPHSPILSVLLYSGLIGLIIYIFFLLKVVQYYLTYHLELFGFGIFFLIIVLFSFISGNSHFSIPALIFITVIPLFYRSVAIKKA